MKIIEEYSGAVNKRVALEFRKFYASVFMKLYSYDCEALKLDITKYAVLWLFLYKEIC